MPDDSNQTPQSSRLVDKSHWDGVYSGGDGAIQPAPSLEKRRNRSYMGKRMWDLTRQFLGDGLGPQKHVIEIGCAPGRFVLEFAKKFGHTPHGIDYSEKGVAQTKTNFEAAGYSAENVLLGDLFSAEVQASLAGRFDVVVSGGFIEHFTDLKPVIEAHSALVRPGGLLIVSIPNYRGLNYAIGQLTVRHLYPLHNFTIMNGRRFRSLFDSPNLETLWCGHCGGFDFGMFDTGHKTRVLKAMRISQALLNIAFSVVPPPETRWTSPILVYFGRKK